VSVDLGEGRWLLDKFVWAHHCCRVSKILGPCQRGGRLAVVETFKATIQSEPLFDRLAGE